VDAEDDPREPAARIWRSEFFALDVNNFAPVIAKIQAAKPDVVWSVLVGGAHIAFYRQFEATIGKKNMMLASTTYGVGREQTELSAQEGDGIIIATSFVDRCRRRRPRPSSTSSTNMRGITSMSANTANTAIRGVSLWAEAVKKARAPKPMM
jgi:branched-chain amino acid transport system substrate-binding protein